MRKEEMSGATGKKNFKLISRITCFRSSKCQSQSFDSPNHSTYVCMWSRQHAKSIPFGDSAILISANRNVLWCVAINAWVEHELFKAFSVISMQWGIGAGQVRLTLNFFPAFYVRPIGDIRQNSYLSGSFSHPWDHIFIPSFVSFNPFAACTGTLMPHATQMFEVYAWTWTRILRNVQITFLLVRVIRVVDQVWRSRV